MCIRAEANFTKEPIIELVPSWMLLYGQVSRNISKLPRYKQLEASFMLLSRADYNIER